MTNPGPDKSGSSEYLASRDLIRSAAKWFIAGLGAIGAVLVAGSQLSSIGALPLGSARLYLAVSGVVVGLLAILWAMWRVVDVLAGRRWAFEDVVAEWNATRHRTSTRGLAAWRERVAHPVGTFFRTHETSLGGYQSPKQIQDIYDESEPDREGLDDLVSLMNDIVDNAATIHLDSRFRVLRRQIAAGVILGAAGIVLFAWAANPSKPEQPAPSLRNAVLRGADLQGASLRNADLTGADMTLANLRGADLRGATIDRTIWSQTICPDGTNSDTSARLDAHDRMAGATCKGHLVP